MAQYLELSVVVDRREIKFKITLQMVDTLAWLCSVLSEFESQNINLDDDPDPLTIKGLATRGLVQLDGEENPIPTKAGLALTQKMDELYSEGQKWRGLKDSGLALRVQASGKLKARRAKMAKSDKCEVCGVVRDDGNTKRWRHDRCNSCFQRERYYFLKSEKAEKERAKIAKAGGDMAAGQPPVTYFGRDEEQLYGVLTVRLYEDEYAMFMAIRAIKEQTSVAAIKEMIHNSASALCEGHDDFDIDGLLQTGQRLLEHSGKKLKAYKKTTRKQS